MEGRIGQSAVQLPSTGREHQKNSNKPQNVNTDGIPVFLDSASLFFSSSLCQKQCTQLWGHTLTTNLSPDQIPTLLDLFAPTVPNTAMASTDGNAAVPRGIVASARNKGTDAALIYVLNPQPLVSLCGCIEIHKVEAFAKHIIYEHSDGTCSMVDTIGVERKPQGI